MSIPFRVLACGAALLRLGAGPTGAPGYHVAHAFVLGGDGGWDYVALDTVGHRLFIARQNRVMVVDPGTGKVAAEIPGLDRAHGIAFAYETGHGFATSGADSSVTMFDLTTLHVLGHTAVAPDDDAILYDPATRRIFTFNGDAHSASVIDPASGRAIGTIDLGGGPEFGVAAGDAGGPGKVGVVADVAPKRGARPRELVGPPRRVSPVPADSGPPPPATPEPPRPRPSILPGPWARWVPEPCLTRPRAGCSSA